jgi:hypothetical protein
MNSFYIYSFDYSVKGKKTSATVIFCPQISIDTNQLQEEIRTFYSSCHQTDKTIILGGKYMKSMAETILDKKDHIFKYIPLREESSFYDNLHFLEFNKNGEIGQILEGEGLKPYKNLNVFKRIFLQEGSQKIFIEKGGLVESTSTQHHYVFPSGKHSDKFLRVANVLLFSSEILFLSYGLLKYFKNKKYEYIYCDTSSINSVALGVNTLLNRFDITDNSIPVNSFNSYDGLYDENTKLKPKSLILISASTSGSIINYLKRKQPEIDSSNIVILYYLENKNANHVVLEQVLCNLTKTKKNTSGIEKFIAPNQEDCKLCSQGSHAVQVSGDVFLLEQPKINDVVITAGDMGVNESSSFVNQFMSVDGQSTILKVNYKERQEEVSSHKRYDIYIDYGEVIDNIKEERFSQHRDKLNAHIDQFVPSNVRWLLHLNDNASQKLANYIKSNVDENYSDAKKPIVISQNEFHRISENKESGSILIVGSCISNGKNLLYLSRALRNYNLRIVYFIGINRYSRLSSNKFLKTNLKYGTYGAENSSYIQVESIQCSNLSMNNSWQQEVDFLKKKLPDIDDAICIEFCKSRIKSIEDCYSDKVRGMHAKLFLPRLLKSGKFEELAIRRNSAFYNQPKYEKNVSQSDVYFNISFVMNRLRNSEDNSHNLIQSTFVRNLISPSNLNRFNDGIIQASILRACEKEELNYAISPDTSNEMGLILVTIIKYWEQEQGEALLEFLFSIASKKMTLAKNDLSYILAELANINNNLVAFYTSIIRENLMESEKK